MKWSGWLGNLAGVTLLIGAITLGFVESGGAQPQEEKMQNMLDVIKGMSQGGGKGKGLDEKTERQLEQLFKGMDQKKEKRQAVQTKKEQQQLEAATVGHGNALLQVGKQEYQLTMITCTSWGPTSGRFMIEARQPPIKGPGILKISRGAQGVGTLQFEIGRDIYYVEGSQSLLLKGKSLEWKGTALGPPDNSPQPLAVRLTCGAEMKDYAASPGIKQPAANNVLTFQLGKESYAFETGYCSTEARHTGNLVVEADVTATGVFRGRPAIILLSKSHPAGSGRQFINMELLLGKLSAKQRTLPSGELQQQLRKQVAAYQEEAMAAVRKKYPPEMFNSVPPAKLPEVLEAQNREMGAVQKRADEMKFPSARSQGTITVKEEHITFRGPKFHTNDASRAPEFKELSGDPELEVTCKKREK